MRPPAMKNNFQIWPANQKVWPPLIYYVTMTVTGNILTGINSEKISWRETVVVVVVVVVHSYLKSRSVCLLIFWPRLFLKICGQNVSIKEIQNYKKQKAHLPTICIFETKWWYKITWNRINIIIIELLPFKKSMNGKWWNGDKSN